MVAKVLGPRDSFRAGITMLSLTPGIVGEFMLALLVVTLGV